MLPYYILIFFPMLIALIRDRGKIHIGISRDRDENDPVIISFFVIFMLMLMLRGMDCGVDTERYHQLFLRLKNWSWLSLVRLEDRDIGYYLLNKIISLFSSQPQALMIVTSFLAVFPILHFYRAEAEIPFLTILLFVTVAPFNMYFSGIRQSLAMGFVFPAWYFAKSKKPLKFILIVLAAMQFHQSAFIMFALYPLYHIRITPKWLFAVVPLMLAVYIFNTPIFNFLTRFLWDDYGAAKSTGSTTVLILLVLFAVYSFAIPDETKMDNDMIGLRNILLLSIVIQCFAPIHVLAMRMNYYFLLFIPILIPKIANRSMTKNRHIANLSIVVMTVFFLAYYFVKAHTGSDILHLYPYVPFWA